MNAHAPSPAIHGQDRQILATQNSTLLRAIAHLAEIGKTDRGVWPVGVVALANETGKDPSNIRKSLAKLAADGLVTSDPIELTPEGADMLARLEILSGERTASAEIPAGFALLRHDEITPDPENAREFSGLEQVQIEGLAATIREHGLKQPPGVRPAGPHGLHILAFGERRWRAWGLLIQRGEWTADHVELCRVEAGDDLAIMEAGLIENLQRSDLSNLEAGEQFLKLHRRLGRTTAKIAAAIGKTPRFVQIAMKVAAEATEADKEQFRESERAKAAGQPGVFSWEALRDTVKTPRHVTALAASPRLAMLVVELAAKVALEPLDVGAHRPDAVEPPDEWTRISAPPGGGYWAQAEDLGLARCVRDVDHGVFGAITSVAQAWLDDQGFGDDREAMVQAVRETALGAMGARLAGESARWATAFLNPPPPRSPAAAEPAATSAVRWDPPPQPPRDSFAQQVREVNLEAGEHHIEALRPATPAADDERRSPPATAAPLALTPPQRLAVIELAHKTETSGVEARGGAIRGARVADYFRDPMARELVNLRLVSWVQAPSGTGFLGVLTQAAWDWLAQELPSGVNAAVVANAQVCVEFDGPADGGTYVTPWINDPSPSQPTPQRPSEPEPAEPAAEAPPASTDPQFLADDRAVDALSDVMRARAHKRRANRPAHADRPWDMADRAILQLLNNDLAGLLAEVAAMAARNGDLRAVSGELSSALHRAGADLRSMRRRLERDSPEYAPAHADLERDD